MCTARKIVSLLILCFLFPFSNFFYDEDDWYILKNPGQIQSFTDDNFRIIIGTINGIFTYDKITEELLYDMYLTRGLPSKDIKHIYYDRNTDHLWVCHDEGISYKPISSFSYHHVSNSDLIDKGLSIIDDIGSSSSYIWLRKSNYIIAINSFTGKFISIDESNDETDDIIWGSSMYGYSGQKIDISKYYSSNPDWSIGYRANNINNQYVDYNVFFDEYGDQAIPTVMFTDLDNNIWIGTDSGYIFNAWRNSNRLEIIDPGIQRGIISGVYINENLNWWFYDSYYKRTSQIEDLLFRRGENEFLTFWNEQEGIWKKYKTNESIEIKSGDVNDIIEYNNSILVGTMYGLLRYQLNNGKVEEESEIVEVDGTWELIDISDGLHDNAVWKIGQHGDRFFILTSDGLNEISLFPYTVIPNSFEDFKNTTILDMSIISQESIALCDDTQNKYRSIEECHSHCSSNCLNKNVNELILSTTKGLTKINFETNMETFLSPRACSQIEIQDFNLFCLERGISRLDMLDSSMEFEQIITDDRIRNFTLSAHYIWVNLIDRAHLKNLNNGESWYYNQGDGIQGSNIYEIGNIDDWIYFISEKGVSLYNWGKFHVN